MKGNFKAKAGALVVLIFWPNLRLAVLIKLVLIKKVCTSSSKSNFQIEYLHEIWIESI